jgi:hypothetical protein
VREKLQPILVGETIKMPKTTRAAAQAVVDDRRPARPLRGGATSRRFAAAAGTGWATRSPGHNGKVRARVDRVAVFASLAEGSRERVAGEVGVEVMASP